MQQEAKTQETLQYLEICNQIESLRRPDLNPDEQWEAILERINRVDLNDKLNTYVRMVYCSAEYLLPGMEGDGGLGALSRDHFLQAIALGLWGDFFGLLHSQHKAQEIRKNADGYYQEIVMKDSLSPESLGMKRTVDLDFTLNGAIGPDCPIETYLHPLSTEHTPLFLFHVPGPVYPEQTYSDARLWDHVVLGFGAQRVEKKLKEQGKRKDVAFIHTNESAMAFNVLAFLDDWTMENGDTAEGYQKALDVIRSKDILTNHTLIDAEKASFSLEQCEKFIFNNIHSKQVEAMLREQIRNNNNCLSIQNLALFLAGKCNGVSEDHANRAADALGREVHVVTNGVYEEGWAPQMMSMLQKYRIIDRFGLPLPDYESRIDNIPIDEFLWNKQLGLNEFRHWLARGNRKDQFGNIVFLPENAKIIGDARRYAGYKRRWMLFKNPEILQCLLANHPDVHIIISGKAHQEDAGPNSDLSFSLNSIAGNDVFRRQIHFIPNWDSKFAELLFPAVNIWINTPRPKEEACGTSGEKAAINGALNVSTRAGFWRELPNGSYFWVAGKTEDELNTEAEIASFYVKLTEAVTSVECPPLYFNKAKDQWKGGILKTASAARMVTQYLQVALSSPQSVQA